MYYLNYATTQIIKEQDINTFPDFFIEKIKTLGDFNFSYDYTDGDPEAQGLARTAVLAKQSPLLDVQIELPNATTDTGHGTYFDFEGYMIKHTTKFDKTAIIDATIAIDSVPTPTAAT